MGTSSVRAFRIDSQIDAAKVDSINSDDDHI